MVGRGRRCGRGGSRVRDRRGRVALATLAVVVGLCAPRPAAARRSGGGALARLERQVQALQAEVDRLKRRECQRDEQAQAVAASPRADGEAVHGDTVPAGTARGSIAQPDGAPGPTVSSPSTGAPAPATAATLAQPDGAADGNAPTLSSRKGVVANAALSTVLPGAEVARPAGEAAKLAAGYQPGGFFIRDEKGEWLLRIGSYLQVDARFFPGDSSSLDPDQFLIRRARLYFEGSLGPWVDFKLQEDFATTATLFDAYADVKPFGRWARIRVGKFKTPVGLERLQSATVLPLVERGQPTNLVPIRGLGAEVWASYLDGTFGYELGAFDEAPDLSNVTGQAFDDFNFFGRVYSQPFARSGIAWISGLGVGMAGSYGRENGTFASNNLPVYRSFGQAAIFTYVQGATLPTTAIADGIASRWNPQASWYAGPFGVEFEYVSSRTPVTLGDVNDTLNNQAWAVTASYALTGEAESWRGIVPNEPFEPIASGIPGRWGAFEIVGRIDGMRIDPDAFRLGFADPGRSIRRDFGFGGGVNWVWSRNVRFSLDYYHTDFKGGWNRDTWNRPTEDAVIGRFQFAL